MQSRRQRKTRHTALPLSLAIMADIFVLYNIHYFDMCQHDFYFPFVYMYLQRVHAKQFTNIMSHEIH